jgi:hypothetical protein
MILMLTNPSLIARSERIQFLCRLLILTCTSIVLDDDDDDEVDISFTSE